MPSVFEASDPVTGLAVSLEVSPQPPRSGQAVRWDLSVANRGDHARALTFPSGQEGDVVLEAGGVARYRWSRDKAFVLMITERELGAGEVWSFTLDDVLDVEPGHYALVASVAATPPPPVVRAELSVD
jgi:hypothetical protein